MGPTTFSDLVPFIAELRAAVGARDVDTVARLLEAPEAIHVPREAREEAWVIVRLPQGSMRAPMQLLRFQHLARQLALGAEPLRDRSQLELPLTARRTPRGGVHLDARASRRQSGAHRDGPPGAADDPDVN